MFKYTIVYLQVIITQREDLHASWTEFILPVGRKCVNLAMTHFWQSLQADLCGRNEALNLTIEHRNHSHRYSSS